MALYAYARVSSKGQNLDRQLLEFERLGVQKVYKDKESGSSFNRREYQKLMKVLKKGDCIFIHELKRLGRNYDEIKEQWYLITKIKCADIVVLDMPLLDTRVTAGNLLNRFIADVVLQILAYCAEQELKDNHKAQAEGIAAAKAKGVKFGRPRYKIDEKIMREACCRLDKGEISLTYASKMVGMSRNGFRKRYMEYVECAGQKIEKTAN